LYNGNILTVDAGFSRREAIAIKDGKVLALGRRSELAKWASPATKEIDLKGRTVLPGLIDNHNHLLMAAVTARGVDLSRVRNMEELKDKIREATQQVAEDQVVFTSMAWHEAQLEEQHLPTRWDLDEAAPNHPVYVIRGGHEAVLNSKALEMAGVDERTPTPEGGKISRDPETGELTGEFVDNAVQVVQHLLPPPPTQEEKVVLLERAIDQMLAAGYTSIRDPGVEPPDMLIYQRLWREKKLKMRVSMMPRLDRSYKTSDMTAKELEDFFGNWGIRDGLGDSMLRIDAVKLGIDGGFEGGLLREPYVETSGYEDDYHGVQRIPTAKFTEMVLALNRRGWRVGTHVVGDLGLDIVLDAYSAADKEKSIKGRRWILEHAFIVHPDQISRIKDLDLVVSAQDHTYMAGSSMIKYWGAERAAATMPVKRLLKEGIIVGAGTDWPVIPYSPFIALYFWVTRGTVSAGEVGGPEQKLTREEALRVQTSAHITFEEDLKGSLEPGKYADLVVIDRDYMTIPESEIRDIQVLATMVDGQWAYQADDFSGY
jgi:predicted amidohydrolase YtcJ